MSRDGLPLGSFAGSALAREPTPIPWTMPRPMAIFDVPQRFSEKWVHDKLPTMDSTEFHAMFHEAATRGWDEDELRQLARMWSEESGASSASPS